MKKKQMKDKMRNRKNYFIWVIGLLFPSIATVISRILIATMSEDIVAEIESEHTNIKVILLTSISLLIGACIAEVAVGIFHYMLQKVRVDYEVNAREDIFTHMIRMKLSVLDKSNRGEMVQRYSNDATMAASAMTTDLESCIYPLLIGIGYCLAIMQKQIFVGIVLFLVIILIAIQNIYFIKKFQRLEESYLLAKENYTGKIDIANSGKMMIRFFELQNFAQDQIVMASNNVYITEKRKARLALKKALSSDMLIALCSTLTLPIVCVVSKYGYLSIPEVMFIASLCSSVMGFTSSFANAFIQLRRDSISKKRIDELLMIEQETYSKNEIAKDTENTLDLATTQTDKYEDSLEIESGEKMNPLEEEIQRCSIKLQDVSIRYGERLILDNISLQLHPGEITALIGKSGSGKSSLLKTLLGFNEFHGSIYIHSMNMDEVTADQIRKSITYVADDSELYHTTIEDNIKYGNPSASHEEVRTAMNAVGLFEFLDNEDTIQEINVGEEGSKLSGGQRQRIAIARALLKNSSIILLDEPTSAMDVMAEKRIMEQLRFLANQGTCILMATHSMSVLHAVDRIIMVKDQKMIDSVSAEEAIEYLIEAKEN